MANAVEHDSSSALATTAEKGVIGATLGFVASVAVGAAAGVAAIFTAAALGGSLGSIVSDNFSAGEALGWLTRAGGGVLALGGIAGGAIGGALGTIPTLAGGMLGGLKGSAKVSREKSAYARLAERGADTKHQKMTTEINNAEIRGYTAGVNDGMQIGFQQGVQHGAEHVINEIQKNAPGMLPPADAAPEKPAAAAGAGTLTMDSAPGAAVGGLAGAAAGGLVSKDGRTAAALAIAHCPPPASTLEKMTQRREDQAARANELG